MEAANFCNDMAMHIRDQSVIFEFYYQEPKAADDPVIKDRVLIKTIAMETTFFRQAFCPLMAKLCGSAQMPPTPPDEPPIRQRKF